MGNCGNKSAPIDENQLDSLGPLDTDDSQDRHLKIPKVDLKNFRN
jgi:hypothetical protein